MKNEEESCLFVKCENWKISLVVCVGEGGCANGEVRGKIIKEGKK